MSVERPTGRRRGYGSMRGKIWLADDWDSDETNDAIAELFFGRGPAYWYRSASAGRIRDARIAGSSVAASATT